MEYLFSREVMVTLVLVALVALLVGWTIGARPMPELGWGWRYALTEVTRHRIAVSKLSKALFPDNSHEALLAATDLQVLRAQHTLMVRAAVMAIAGLVLAGVAIAIPIRIVHETFHLAASEWVNGLELNHDSAAIAIARVAAVAALVMAVVIFLMRIASAFFHESAVCFHRLHSLRFGRLYLHIHEGAFAFDELNEAFRWNHPVASMFDARSIGDPSSPMSSSFAKAKKKEKGVAESSTDDTAKPELASGL